MVLVEPGQTATSFPRHAPHAFRKVTARAFGLPPESVPNFEGGHAPPEFLRALSEHLPSRFLDPERVADAVVAAILDQSAERIVLRPS